jgi:GAF domain-containing protein
LGMAPSKHQAGMRGSSSEIWGWLMSAQEEERKAISRELVSELDPQRLLQGFGTAARDIIGARHSITGILDETGSRLRWLFTSGMDAGAAAKLGSPDPRAGVLKTILWECRPTRLRNADANPESLGLSAGHPAIHSWLGVPIASPTRVYGYIGLIDKVGLDQFSEEDERLGVILAAQVGRVYQNGSLYADVLAHAANLEREVAARQQTERALADRARQASLIAQVGAILTRSDTAQEMLQRCAEALAGYLEGASPKPSSCSSDTRANRAVFALTYTGTTISSTRSRISTNCAAPVFGWTSSFLLSAHA